MGLNIIALELWLTLITVQTNVKVPEVIPPLLLLNLGLNIPHRLVAAGHWSRPRYSKQICGSVLGHGGHKRQLHPSREKIKPVGKVADLKRKSIEKG